MEDLVYRHIILPILVQSGKNYPVSLIMVSQLLRMAEVHNTYPKVLAEMASLLRSNMIPLRAKCLLGVHDQKEGGGEVLDISR